LERAAMAKRTARTLARVYFDQGEHAKAWDIYANFLLKLNPAQPSDWVEAAWNLYRLKRPAEALGMLYNLESKAAASTFVNLEKYRLRALVYRSLCQPAAADSLIESFDKEFGKTLEGIKRGEPLSRLDQLVRIEVPENLEYRQLSLAIPYLNAELAQVGQLP